MKKFKLYVNESKKDDELLFYKNYVFTEGMIVLDDGFYYSWKYFTNFSEDGEMTIKTKSTKPTPTKTTFTNKFTISPGF